MTQPRKEQIKDLKAKFTLVDKVGASSSFSGDTYYVFDSGGDTRYTDLLAKTVTGAVGGAEANVRPTVWGGSGPWSASAGQQFAITQPGVSSGTPVTVTLQSSDVVLISGVPKVTPAKLAARINAVMVAAGVSTTVASYELGRIVLRAAGPGGPLTGPAASITVTDVTPGMAALFGFGSSPVSRSGATGPVRGVSCLASDLGGGVAPIVRTDGGPSVPDSTLMHVGGYATAPRFRSGSSVYGRIVSAPLNGTTPNLAVSFYRSGTRPPKIVTGGADFAAMGVGDSIDVTVTDASSPGFGTVTFTVSLAAVTSQATFVSAVNAAFDAAIVSATGVTGSEPGRAAVRSAPQPYALKADALTVKFGASSPVTATLTATTATEVVTQVNAAIALASLTAVGEAVLMVASGISYVVIRSKTSDGGSMLISGAAADKAGLPYGTVTGFQLCKADGSAEAVLTFPGPAGSSLSITGSSGTMGRLGFSSTTVTSNAAPGEEPVTAPACKLLIPEVMEFGEVPDSYDSSLIASLIAPPLRSATGHAQDALWSPLLGSLGKILPSLIPALEQAVAESVVLGSGKTDTSAELLRPRMTVPYNGTVEDMMLLMDVPDVSGSGYHYRVYFARASAPDGLIVTANASFNGTSWTKDVVGFAALGGIGSGGLTFWIDSSGVGTGITWKEAFRANSNNLVKIGDGVNSNVMIPRIWTPEPWEQMLHVWQSYDSTLGDNIATKHFYSKAGAAGGEFWISNNAYLDGANWTQDDATKTSSALLLQNGRIRIFGQPIGSSPWSSWTHTAFDMDLSDASTRVGQFETGVKLGATLSSSLANNIIPRIETPFTPGSGDTERTLIHKAAPIGSSQGFYVYAGSNSFGSGLGKDLLYVCNAYWDGTNWIRENASADAFAYMMNPVGTQTFIKKSGTGNSWVDASWVQTTYVNSYGIKLSFPDDVGAETNAAFKNYLHQHAVAKAWGKVLLNSDGSTATISVLDSFGISGAALLDDFTLQVTLTKALTSASACSVTVNTYRRNALGTNLGAAARFQGYPTSTTTIDFIAHYLSDGSIVNLNTQPTVPTLGSSIQDLVLDLTVHGKQ